MTRLSAKGQVTIPRALREQLGLRPGVAIRCELNAAGELVLRVDAVAPKSRFEKLRARAALAIDATDIRGLTRRERP